MLVQLIQEKILQGANKVLLSKVISWKEHREATATCMKISTLTLARTPVTKQDQASSPQGPMT
jgi:hypothetical protein